MVATLAATQARISAPAATLPTAEPSAWDGGEAAVAGGGLLFAVFPASVAGL